MTIIFAMNLVHEEINDYSKSFVVIIIVSCLIIILSTSNYNNHAE